MSLTLTAEHPYHAHVADAEPLTYRSWSDFLEEWEGDDDLNFVIRWDYDDSAESIALVIYQQRKGRLIPVDVRVRARDQERVLDYLSERWKYMCQVWRGVSP